MSEPVRAWLADTLNSDRAAEVVEFVVGTPLLVIAVLVGAVLVRIVAHRAIRRAVDRIASGTRRRGRLDILDAVDPVSSERRGQRAKAIGSLLTAAVSVLVWVLAAFVILPELGIEITGLVAGAGIVGVALAFGTQTLVADLVSGIFMIAEDQYGVGDVIDMGEATGVVEAIGLRTTRLRAVDGTVWHVRNGEVKRVGNMSQGWSRALLDVEVAYREDPTRVMEVLRDVGCTLKEDPDFGPKFLDEPEIWGLEAFGTNAMVIRMIIKTRPLEQWTVAREMRRRIKLEFDRLGIDIPFAEGSMVVRTDGPGAEDGSDVVPIPPVRPVRAASRRLPPRGEADATAEDIAQPADGLPAGDPKP